MNEGLTHQEIEALLGAYALDAVDQEEADAVARHLLECPRCRAEVAQHREVAARLAHSGASAPSGVWQRIASALEETPPHLALAPARPRTGRWRGVRTRVAALTAVAAVVVGGLSFELVRVQGQVNQVRANALQHVGLDQVVANALLGAHREVQLSSARGRVSALLILTPGGQGYLVHSSLPALPTDETYQLWALIGSHAVSLGLLGPRPSLAAFGVDPHANIKLLMITVEPSGGVVSTREPAVVWGAPPPT